MGSKAAEKYLVCLCYNCHIEKLHRHGEKKFWLDLKYTLEEIEMFALDLYIEYLMRKL
jgi:predicted HNH restriction endonuclease